MALVTEARWKTKLILIVMFLGYKEAFPHASCSTILPFLATRPTAPANAPASQAVLTPLHAADNFLEFILAERGGTKRRRFFLDLELFKVPSLTTSVLRGGPCSGNHLT